jgi:two-component system NarL family sensor kinase
VARPGDQVAGLTGATRTRAGLALGIALVIAIAVVALRVANAGDEPEGENWSLVAGLVLGFAYLPAGAVLTARRDRRLLGGLFLVVGVCALLDALSTQYLGYESGRKATVRWTWLADLSTWVWLVGGGTLATLVLFVLLPRSWQADVRVRAAMGVAAVGILVTAVEPDLWVGPAVVALMGLTAVTLLAVRWRLRRRHGDDPLPAWLLAGGVVAVLGVVPPTFEGVIHRLPAPDVVAPLLLIATVPLLVVGALIEIVRLAPSGLERASHQFLEWVLLATGIVVIYTVLVAGLGRMVGGSGPTWLLVAATGAIALLVEPARQRIRELVDRLVYGSRDDTLSLVRQVMAHVSSVGPGEDLLPGLAASLGREMRLDSVVIDVAARGGWERAAAYEAGSAPKAGLGRRHELLLRHHDEVVGRVVVGWADAPSLRPRDAATLDELAAPLALAVSWVRLAADLRRSSLAVLSAREEERRRLRRDLHDGLGPALTGISLGLRTAIRQLERTDASRQTMELLSHLADEVDTTVGEVKRIVRDLRPSALDELGLMGAVAEFARSIDGAVHLRLELPGQEPALPAAVEVAVYRIVTEALTNVVRHAHAATCWLRIDARDVVEIDVVDDGVGLNGRSANGVGLAAMRERAAELGGIVTLGPRRPHGTHLHVRLPAVLP